MRKVSKISDLIGMGLEVNVVSNIEEQLNILDESYGTERNIDADLGGYVLVVESKGDVIEVKENILLQSMLMILNVKEVSSIVYLFLFCLQIIQ